MNALLAIVMALSQLGVRTLDLKLTNCKYSSTSTSNRPAVDIPLNGAVLMTSSKEGTITYLCTGIQEIPSGKP